MRRATAAGILALIITGSAHVPAGADEPPASTREGTKLLKEGDGFADKGDYTEAVIRYKRAFERILPGLRKSPFLHEVKRDVTKRENLKEMLIKELDEDMTPEEFRANETAMKAFGLLPRGYHLKEELVKVYSEEIAAFYDPKTKTMHLIEEPKKDPSKKPGLLERLLGKGGDFDKDENKTVIAHELTHALADQHYDLDALHKLVKKDDDRAMALSSLIEGEATLTMLGAGMEDWGGEMTQKLPAESLDRTFKLMSSFMPFMSGGKSLGQAPPIIAESMIFPYFKGAVFCAKLTNDGGWKSIDTAYQMLPQSTEQIIHPEKFLANPDHPMRIELAPLNAGEGWKELGQNVLGEMQMSVMLRKHKGDAAAAGWDGDRYAAFEGTGDRLGLVWLTTWDSEADAREFTTAYAQYQTARFPDLPRPSADVKDTLWRGVGGPLYAIQRRGLDVAVVEGFSPEATVGLLEAAFRSKKTEVKPVPVPKPAADKGGPPAPDKPTETPKTLRSRGAAGVVRPAR
jgi:hypothetical protein